MSVKIKLADALIELLGKKSFNHITVQMVIEQSGVSRSSFYRNFHDLYDVICWYYSFSIDPILERFNGSNWNVLIFEIVDFYNKNKTFAKAAICIEGQNSFIDFLQRYVFDFYSSNYLKQVKKDSLSAEEEQCIKFAVYGQVYTIKDWVENGYNDSPNSKLAIYSHVMPDLLKKYF